MAVMVLTKSKFCGVASPNFRTSSRHEIFIQQMLFGAVLMTSQDDDQLVENWDKKVWGSGWSDSDITGFLDGTRK